METKISIALITSGTSLVVAVVSLLSSYLNNRKLTKATQDLETLKFEIEKRRVRFRLFDKGMVNKLTAIEGFISQIQIFKDHLLLIENSMNDSLDTKTILTQIIKSMGDLFSLYEVNSQYLDKEDGSLFAAHSAKNLIMNIENDLNQLFSKREFVNISKAERLLIEKKRDQLTELQNTLRDNRFKILSDAS